MSQYDGKICRKMVRACFISGSFKEAQAGGIVYSVLPTRSERWIPEMTFAEKLRTARKEAGLTQKELAQQSRLALRTIASYEAGDHLPKKEETYSALAAVLGVTPDSLMDENSEFVIKAEQQYGGKGSKQAEELVRSFRVAAAGGELDDDDLDFIKDAMLQTYWDAKRYNQRFKNKRN